jgi:hypothetical protein
MIDYYLPEFDYNEIHSKIINAPLDKVYNNLRHLDFAASWISRWLFKIRGLGTNAMSFDLMVDTGSFFTIYEKENNEWVVGLLADSFRMPVNLTADQDFRDWNPGKGIKIAWNFKCDVLNKDKVKVSTETRIKCLNKKSKFVFSIYWFFVRPFSGLIRREMLRILDLKCRS